MFVFVNYMCKDSFCNRDNNSSHLFIQKCTVIDRHISIGHSGASAWLVHGVCTYSMYVCSMYHHSNNIILYHPFKG